MKLMTEVIEEPSEIRKSGVSMLLSHVMRITSSRLHSRIETLLPLLVDESSFQMDGQRANDGLYVYLNAYHLFSGYSCVHFLLAIRTDLLLFVV